MMEAQVVARNVFNVERLRTQQIEAIRAITVHENVIAVLPTGCGKSLCYQVGTMMGLV
jgi:ATP-dependent DNA helicase RecQ